MPAEVRPITPEEYSAVRALLSQMRDCVGRHGAPDAEYSIDLRGRRIRKGYRVYGGEDTVIPLDAMKLM